MASADRALPLVSIITPTYNRAGFLEETIDSILNQDYGNLELIVLDDGSTDDTQARLARYRDRATLLHHDNQGENATVNKGFTLARGKYVCVVNSDDPLLPGGISKLVRALESDDGALIAYGDWAAIGPRHEFLRHERLKTYTTENMLRDVNFGMGPGMLIRRAAIDAHGGRDAQYRFAGDMEFCLRLSLYGRFIHIPEILATHRIHPDSASVHSRRQDIGYEFVDAFERTLRHPRLPEALRRDRARLHAKILDQQRRYYSDYAHTRIMLWLRATSLREMNSLRNIGRRIPPAAARSTILKPRWRFGAIPWRRPAHALADVLIRTRARLSQLGQWLSQITLRLSQVILRLLKLLLWPLKRTLRAGISLILDLAVAIARLVVRPGRAPIGQSRAVFAFSTRFLPPLWSGQSVMIGRLLQGADASLYRLIGHPLTTADEEQDYIGRLPGNRYRLGPVRYHPDHAIGGKTLARLSRWPLGGLLRQALRTFLLFAGTIERGAQIYRALRDDCPRILVGCSGDKLDPPATWLAARLLRTRIALYFFDDYTEQWWAEPEIGKSIAFIQRYIARRSDLLITPNWFMQAKLIALYDRPCQVIPNPMPTVALPQPVLDFPATPGALHLVFTGAVYHLNYGVFRAIAAALDRLPHLNGALHIYTAQQPEALAAEGLSGPRIRVLPHAPPDQAAAVQARADILLIPFDDDPRCHELVRTSATAKLADYLAVGRPILAICPADSYLAWYLTTHQCGAVVHGNAPAAIAEAIQRIALDRPYRETLMDNARTQACIDFDPARAGQKLRDALESAA